MGRILTCYSTVSGIMRCFILGQFEGICRKTFLLWAFLSLSKTILLCCVLMAILMEVFSEVANKSFKRWMMIHDGKLDCESLINFSMYIDFDWKILYISFDICMQMLGKHRSNFRGVYLTWIHVRLVVTTRLLGTCICFF